MNDTYERYQWNKVGGQLEIVAYRDAQFSQGEYWSIQLYKNEGGQLQLINQKRYDFLHDVGMGCIKILGNYTCTWGNLIPASINRPYDIALRYKLNFSYNAKCLEDGEYVLKAEHAGNVISSQSFRPTPFTPIITSTITAQSIPPSIPLTQQPYISPNTTSVVPATPAGESHVMANISDGLGCMNANFLEDIEVTIHSTVVPDSASHRHFTSINQPGTGKFYDADPSRTTPESSPTTSSTPSEITLKPDELGNAWAMYKAGHFGVDEKIEITAKNTASGAQSSAEHLLAIQVPGLVTLDTSNSDYYVRGTGNLGCDLGHNDSATVRRSHYVRPEVKNIVTALAKYYTHKTGGLKLSFNDASLQYGGFFDKGNNANLDKRCHWTHREGIDIDVNSAELSACPNEDNLDCLMPGLSTGNQETTRLEFITNTVEQWQGYRWKEGDLIHYRFNYLH